MKSVVHVITTIMRGGAENQLKVLVREQRRNGWDVTVVFLKGDPELHREFENQNATVNTQISKHIFVKQIFELRKLLNSSETIVHAHLPRAELVCALTLKSNKLIVTRHNAEPFFPGAPSLISLGLSRFVASRAHRIIAITQAVKMYLITAKEVNKKTKISVVTYGFDEENLAVNSHPKNLTTGKMRIGSVGRLVQQKDFPTLLEAFKLFHKKVPESELVIVGDGVLHEELHKLADNLGISGSTKWLGRVEDPLPYLKSMDIFVLPSKYEGLGLVLLEAMQMKTPIIGSRAPAIVEVLGDDSEALFEIGAVAELCRLLEKYATPKTREELISAQQNVLAKFSPVIMHTKISTVYQEVVS